ATMMPSRDVHTPRFVDQDEQEGRCPGIFRPRRMHLAAMTAAQSGHSANYLCRLRAKKRPRHTTAPNAAQTFSSCQLGDLSARLVSCRPPPLDFLHGYLHAG